MIDIKRTFYTWSDTQNVATGFTVSEEGQGLVGVLENGIEKVKPAAADSSPETLVGFAMFRQQTFSTEAVIEEHIVPTASPYVIELGKNNLLGTAPTGQIRVYDEAAEADLTQAVAASSGYYLPDLTAGTVTFHEADKGKAVIVYYRYAMTVAEAILHYYEAPTNHPDPNYFEQVGVGKGKGRVFSMYYDQTIDWSAVTTPAVGADGMFVNTGGNNLDIPNGRVVSVPTSSDPYLGIEFLI